MRSSQIRERFIRFFEGRGHRHVESSSLIPAADPTLLFINSGMAQFKDLFLGFEKRDYSRAVTSQRCLRAGGKHNDLENVGYTSRHHTFFEMLGNFSFGDYFKREAISSAWRLLTDEREGYGIDPRHLWITVFGGGRPFGTEGPEVAADTDARLLWQQTLEEAGFSSAEAAGRITEVATADNFWMMGDTGPCGPCSEIFHNRNRDAGRFEGGDERCADSCVEVWNLVFMQFNRDEAGALHDLPSPCVDTGMGLERLAAILQGVDGNYETDALARLVAAAADAVAAAGGSGRTPASLRVIADHIRAAAFLVADGVYPSNEGRGYVLRRIIRRALRHGHKLGASGRFFAPLAGTVAELMADAHPVVGERLERVQAVLGREEEAFARTLHAGMAILERSVGGDESRISGRTAFELYDTYGFPLDLTQDYARERNLQVDVAGFEEGMRAQRARSRAATSFKADQQAVSFDGAATEFLRGSAAAEARVAALHAGGGTVASVGEGEEALVMLDRSPFYAETGGQVGDTGELEGPGGRAQVLDTFRLRADVHAHRVRITAGELASGERVQARIDADRRAAVCRAHSATHLLHAALHRVAGEHATQRGSLVAADRLRFDFACDGPLSASQLSEVEDMINGQVAGNSEVTTEEMAYDDAIRRGAMALFGEKYGSRVRVVAMAGDHSVELCGGTHVDRTGSVGFVRLIGEEGVAAGVRRVEALTAASAVAAARAASGRLAACATMLKAPVDALERRITQLLADSRSFKRQLAELEQGRAAEHARALVAGAERRNGSLAMVGNLGRVSQSGLRAVAAEIGKLVQNESGSRKGRQPYAAMLFSVSGGRLFQLAVVDRLDAGAADWLAATLEAAGTAGGGSARMAQAAGSDPGRIEAGIAAARKWIETALAG